MPTAGIKLDLSALGRISWEAQNAALETVAALRGEVVSAQVMPFDTGNMQNNATYVNQQVNGSESHTMLATDSPQARRLYFHPEYNFQKGKNPNAQGRWLDAWLPGGEKEDFIPDTYRERLKARIEK